MDTNNVTVDTFGHTSNTQRENVNAILTSENLDKSDVLTEILKWVTINDAAYYESDKVNANDSKYYPASNPNTVTHTSDGKKEKSY